MTTLLDNIYVYFCVISIHFEEVLKYNKATNIQRFLPAHISKLFTTSPFAQSKDISKYHSANNMQMF